MGLGEAFGIVAPYYNLALVTVVIILFISLFKVKNRKLFNKPWLLLFIAICVFVLEEIMTVIRAAGLIYFPQFIFGFFEMIIISLFIYMLLLQKEHIKLKHTKGGKHVQK